MGSRDGKYFSHVLYGHAAGQRRLSPDFTGEHGNRQFTRDENVRLTVGDVPEYEIHFSREASPQ